MKIKIEELKDYVVNLYTKESSLLILGPPGIGKSTGVNEASEKMSRSRNKEFVIYDDSRAEEILAEPEKYFVLVNFHLNEVEPQDLMGIPKEKLEGIYYKPFLWALVLSKAEGVLFLDDFTNIQRLDVITAAFNLILDHKAGFTKFNENVMVVAAGNSPEESSVSNLLPVPLIDRFTIINTEKPTVEAWADWMDRNFDDWNRRTLGYLKYFPQEFLKLPDEPEVLKNFPSPRSWTKVATLLPQISTKSRQQKTIIEGRLGAFTGEKFSTFLKNKIPPLEEFLSDPKKLANLGMDQQYLISISVGDYLGKNIEKDKEFKKAIPLLKTMQREFMVVSIISSGKHKREIALRLTKKDKKLKECLKQVSTLQLELEN